MRAHLPAPIHRCSRPIVMALLALGLLPAVAAAEALTPLLLYRINAGGPAVGALDSEHPWAEDSAASPSSFSNHAETNTATRSMWFAGGSSVPEYVPSDVFWSERYGPMQWDFPAPANLHVEVRLFFAETFDGITGAGQRVFNLRIENQLVLDHFDIYAEYGRRGALMKTFAAVVSADGNLDIDFDPVIENPLVNGIEIRTDCRVSTPEWQNASFSEQTRRFSVEYDATPLASGMDGLTALSAGPGSTYTDFAVLVRFSVAGRVEARDGSVYRADTVIAYAPGTPYHFRLVINVPEHRYDAYVTPSGGAALTLGTNLAFRTEQSGVASLTNWALQCSGGTHEVCNFIVHPYVHNLTADTWHPTIQAAIDAANTGDVLVLSPGIYTGAGNRDVESGDKSLTIRSTDPSDPAVVQRTVIDVQGDTTNRHRAFCLRSDGSATVDLAGLTLVNGHAPLETVDGQDAPAGGAIFCTGVALNLDHCALRDNRAWSPADAPITLDAYGGGVYCVGPSISISHCTISGNSTIPGRFCVHDGNSSGGGLYLICPDAISIDHCTISGNSAYGSYVVGTGKGGGLYAAGPTVITNSDITGNLASGSEAFGSGGGVFSSGSLVMSNCTISDNQADGGNEVSPEGGGIHCAGSAWIEDCTIERNGRWARGGGVYCASTANTQVVNCILKDNIGGGTRYEGGGGGGAVSGAGLVRNCLIMGNTARNRGGGLDRCGTIIGCSILGNWADEDGGAVAYSGPVKNCLVWGNYSRYEPAIWSSGPVTYSCIDDPQYLGEGNIHLDPRLEVVETGSLTSSAVMDPPYSEITVLSDTSKNWQPGSLVGTMINPDLSQTRQFRVFANTETTVSLRGDATFAQAGAGYHACDFHLQPCSPCINAGDPAGDYTGQTDFEGRPRVSHGRIDIGAHEFDIREDPVPGPPVEPKTSFLYVCPGECSTLSATLCSGGDVLEWLTAGGSLLPGGASPTVCPESTATFYARARTLGPSATSLLTPITVQVSTPYLWHPMGRGLNDAPLVLGSYRRELIAGGHFNRSGETEVNGIARWDGAAWQPLGEGVNYSVYALRAYGGELIAGGSFDQAGGVPAPYIARWNGLTWNAVGNGTNGAVRALAVYEDGLIVGGDFTSANGTVASYVARWNGIGWEALGGGADDTVSCLLVHGSDLVAAGRFTTAGGTSANRIARWNGSSWQPLGGGMDNAVLALAVYKNQLIAAGDFVTADGKTVNHVARWDGSQWNPLGSGTNGWVNAMSVYGGELIVGGGFTSAGGVGVTYMAAWNGLGWRDLGTSLDTGVNALAVHHRELMVGGNFTSIGGVATKRIAGWGCCSQTCAADLDRDCDVDTADLAAFVACSLGPDIDYSLTGLPPGCPLWPDEGGRIGADFDRDGDVDVVDFAGIQRCFGGPGRPMQPGCID